MIFHNKNRALFSILILSSILNAVTYGITEYFPTPVTLVKYLTNFGKFMSTADIEITAPLPFLRAVPFDAPFFNESEPGVIFGDPEPTPELFDENGELLEYVGEKFDFDNPPDIRNS